MKRIIITLSALAAGAFLVMGSSWADSKLGSPHNPNPPNSQLIGKELQKSEETNLGYALSSGGLTGPGDKYFALPWIGMYRFWDGSDERKRIETKGKLYEEATVNRRG
jgi:hypothetical protein